MESLGCICKSWMGYDHEADLGSHPHWSMGQQCDLSRHPQQRWDCDMYYEPDADQTSGLSYTCHGGFSDGAPAFSRKFEHCSKRLLVEDCMGFYQLYPILLPILGIIRINSGCRVLPHTFAVSKVLSSSTASFLTFLQLKHEVRGMGFSSILWNGSSMSSMLQVWIQHSGKCWRRGIIQLSTPH